MDATWNYPRFIAHRGAGRLAPENTLAAMQVGVAHGYCMAEYDVKSSADGVPFLLHDDTLERTTDGTGDAGSLPYGSLALLDAGSWHGAPYAGEPLPSLRAIARYTQANDMASNIEIKPSPGRERETGEQVARAAQDFWRDARLPPLLSSFSEIALAAAAQAAPDLPRALLIDGEPPADWQQRTRQLGCIAVNLDNAFVREAIVRDVRAAQLRLVVWTVNEPARAQQLLDWGADAIITDKLDCIGPA